MKEIKKNEIPKYLKQKKIIYPNPGRNLNININMKNT